MDSSWDWPGSRWWRVDLHAHTPESYDYGTQSDREKPDWTRWVTAVRDAGIQAVAVSDHNTAEAIERLQDAASQVDAAPVLLPGVEFTSADGSHLLLLMDTDRTQQHIDDILSRMKITVGRRGQRDGRSPIGVEQVLEECGHEVLVVGAHVNGPDGLLGLTGQQRIAVLRHRGLAAVEVDPSKEVDESWLDGSRPEIGRRISKVWSSDGHGFGELGRRFTWVKMTRPTLEGLRLALLDGVDSLKPANGDNPGDPNTVRAHLVIESIAVHEAQFMGRASPTTVKLSPWLNAIIGGRGTGKSTLVDFFRKTLRRESELDGRSGDEEGLMRRFFDSRMSVPASRGGDGLLTEDTRIELVYRRDDERFLLSWSRDGSAHPIARLDADNRTAQEGDIRERFPVRIYSQKQLFALAQDPNALLEVIDDSPAVHGAELNRAMEQLETRYLSLCAQARAARNQVAGLPDRRAALADVRHKLDVLQEGGHTQVLNTYRIRRQQDDTWQAVLRGASQVVESVGRSAEELTVADLDFVVDPQGDPARARLRRAHEALTRTVEGLRRGVRGSVEETQRDIEGIKTGPDASLWRKAIDASESDHKEASARLAEEGIANPNEYNELLERATALEREVADFEKERERAKELENEAAEILDEYRERRSELSGRRQDFVKETSGETIRVRVGAIATHGNLARELEAILGISSFRDDRRAIERRIRPEGDRTWDWARLDDVVAEMRRFLSGDLSSWETHDARFESRLRRVPPERIDRLALYLPNDSVTVNFQDHRGGGWKSLRQGSPGQQTAALLAFVLGYGSEPIILDQPEDDLDNTLVYELLVSRLRETKLKRQVIVVTHNPNIVVHGDAELVLSLEAAGGRSHIACEGGLQERRVRDEICRVMEGGLEAFKSRYQRIISPEEAGP